MLPLSKPDQVATTTSALVSSAKMFGDDSQAARFLLSKLGSKVTKVRMKYAASSTACGLPN